MNKQRTLKKDQKELDDYFNRSVDLPKVNITAIEDLRGHKNDVNVQSIGDLEINNDIDASRLYRNNKLNRQAGRNQTLDMQMNINENVSPRNNQRKMKPHGRLFDDFLEGEPSSHMQSR